jgi:hypothetical protein
LIVKKKSIKLTLSRVIIHNFYLRMRWTSEVVNPRMVVFPEGFSWRENNLSRVLTTWCSPYMKAITVLLYQNYSKMFITWMFSFAEDNKIISGIENTMSEQEWKKTQILWLSGVVDQATTYFLPLHYIRLGCSPDCLPCQQIFRKIVSLLLLNNIIKKKTGRTC